MTTLNPPSGRTIVLELQREMEARLYPLMYRTLAPSVFHVYLHPDDYREVQPIAPAIVADAQQGLNNRVDELNARSRWTRLVSGKQAPIEVPPGGWEIHLHAEPNGELSRGEIGIESQLSIPPPPRYDGGAATTRIARTTVTGTLRRQMSERLVAAASPASPASAAPASAPPASMPASATPPPASAVSAVSAVSAASALATPRPASTGTPSSAVPSSTVVPFPTVVPQPAVVPSRSAEPSRSPQQDDTATQESAPPRGDSSAASRARLTYTDEQGAHVYAMRKDLISIGRGGSAHWVDVQVVASTRVSREHCRIRRAADGRFYLQDVSTWGTSVNGTRVQPFARQVDGRVEELGHEQLLTSPAQIQLADAVTIEFALEG